MSNVQRCSYAHRVDFSHLFFLHSFSVRGNNGTEGGEKIFKRQKYRLLSQRRVLVVLSSLVLQEDDIDERFYSLEWLSYTCLYIYMFTCICETYM